MNRIFYLRIFCLSLLFCSFLFAASPRPVDEFDYGMVFRQRANVFPSQPWDIPIFNSESLHDDIEFFRRLSPSRYQAVLAQLELSILTELQSGWEGILMETLAKPIRQREVIHPRSYLRAGIVFPKIIMKTTKQEVSLGAFDLKGLGLSQEGEDRFRLFHSALLYILGNTAMPQEPKMDLHWTQTLTELEKFLQKTRERKDSIVRKVMTGTPEQMRNARKIFHEMDLNIKLSQYLILGMRNLASGKVVTKSLKDSLIETLRGMDYQNGLLPFDRALKEYFMSLAWQRYFKRYNSIHKTTYAVVPAYGVGLLPVNILLPGGRKKRGAVLVRPGTWRNHDNEAMRKLFPLDMVQRIIGEIQTTYAGEMIDLENPGMAMAPKGSLFRYDDISGHPIDRACERVAQAYLAGDREPLDKLTQEVITAVDAIEIPETPYEVKAVMPPESVETQSIIAELEHSRGPATANIKTRVGKLLDVKSLSVSEKTLVMLRLMKADQSAGSEAVVRELNKLRTRVAGLAARRTRGTNTLEVPWVGDCLAFLFSVNEPYLALNPVDSIVLPAFFDLPHDIYAAMVSDLSRLVYVNVSHRMHMSEFVYASDSTASYMADVLIREVVRLALLDRQGKDLQFSHQLTHEKLPMAIRNVSDLVNIISGVPQIFQMILLSAETFVGAPLSEKLIRMLDPTDRSKSLELRRALSLERQYALVRVKELRSRGMEENCAIRLVMGELEARFQQTVSSGEGPDVEASNSGS